MNNYELKLAIHCKKFSLYNLLFPFINYQYLHLILINSKKTNKQKLKNFHNSANTSFMANITLFNALLIKYKIFRIFINSIIS